jgi:iron-sulfur cluster assembly protein
MTSLSSPATGHQSVTATAAAAAPPKGIALTEAAVRYARQKLEKRGTPDAALRVGVRGGGCAGYTYVIEFADEGPSARDRMFEFDGLRVYVDKKSLILLAGTVLDYERTLMFQGFKFVNPQASSSCNCGHSFTVG